MQRSLVVLGLLLALAFAACGGDDGDASPSPSSSVSVTPTAMATQTPQTTLPPAADGHRLVFVRPVSPDARHFNGQLWMSRLDGSDAAPVTPDGVIAAFAGMPNDRSFFYVEFQGAERILWLKDFADGPPQEIMRFQGRFESDGYAQVSPEGGRVAYVDIDSVYLRDLASGETMLLLQGDTGGCDFGPVGCYGYRAPSWSPDGRLLAAQKVYYEGADIVVVDPENPVERIVADRALDGASYFGWSPAGDAVCMAGRYAAQSALYVSRAPDWSLAQSFFDEFESQGFQTPRLVGGTPVPGRTVTGCGWTGDDRLVVSIAHVADEGISSLAIVDTQSGETSLTDLNENDPWGRTLVATPGGRFVISQAFPTKSSPRTLTRPLVLDSATQALTPVLQAGDWVVAVVAP